MSNIPDTTWLERVKIEAEDLDDKINKLGKFFDTDQFRALGMDHRVVLVKQLTAMCDYHSCLKLRIKLSETKPTEGTNDDNDAGC